MSSRVTVKELRARLSLLKLLYGWSFEIDVAYGRPRVISEDGRELSPRLSTGLCALWLDGFSTGAEEHARRSMADKLARHERKANRP